MTVSDTIPKSVLDTLQRSFTVKSGPPPEGAEIVLVNTKYGKNSNDPLSFGFNIATHRFLLNRFSLQCRW